MIAATRRPGRAVRGRNRIALPLLVALTLLLAAPALARAAVPYPPPPAGQDPNDYADYTFLAPGVVPPDLSGNETWMYSATPDSTITDPLVPVNNASPYELGGVRGAHIADADPEVEAAWQVTTGRPDVPIAVLDSGIKWNDRGAMVNLRKKTRLSKGELSDYKPAVDSGAPHEPGADCSAYEPGEFDANGDGIFNVVDYACDSRVDLADPRRVGPPQMLVPQDVLIAFSDDDDDDGNGFVDDIAGWDFLDDDNDPYDDVQYGHGTGEANDSTAEADNDQGGVGTCPNCTMIPLRVGDSFIADVNRFAAATLYAVDNGALVVQEALGTLNNSRLARQAVEYAYRHGVTVIASAADEAAQHNNWPSSLPHVVLVNSVTDYDPVLTPLSRSYLQFNGCTNFNAKITVAIPSVSCSSDATGRGAGIAGLIYSAALNARDEGELEPHPSCKLADGSSCAIGANEVRQLMASGAIGATPFADDVDFASLETSCATVPLGCTNPFLSAPPLRTVTSIGLVPTTRSYPARGGHDQFYGYGRVNVNRGVRAVDPASGPSKLPPEVEITSPQWYELVDPAEAGFDLGAEISTRSGSYTCRVEVAPGQYPGSEGGGDDFHEVPSQWCDGTTPRSDPFDGVLVEIDVAQVKSLFSTATTPESFSGRSTGTLPVEPNGGRPAAAPYAFTVRVIAETSQAGTAISGQDHRSLHLHRDQDMLPAFPRRLPSDGASSPALADLDGDNRAELVFGTSDGLVHAWDEEGDELPGWPVSSDRPGFVASHAAAPAYRRGAASTKLGGAILASVAVADADRDGIPEVYAADFEGQVYGWDPSGREVFRAESNPRFSGAPLAPFRNVRQGSRHRTQRGFFGSPALADLDGDDGGRLEIVAAAMDRHVYAWNDDGSPVPGFPVLAVDYSKLDPADPVDDATHRANFDLAAAGPALDQGAIVDTPAVADIAGDERPEIIVGTNEEYAVDEGNEGRHNVGLLNGVIANVLGPTGLLDYANGRVYAIKPGGDPDTPAAGETPFLEGWPAKVGLLLAELLPVVGEGVNGSPVVAPVTCPSGGKGRKVGVIPAAGIGYIFNPDATSCYGREPGTSRDIGLNSDLGTLVVNQRVDLAIIPALGLPAFGQLLPAGEPTFLAPATGLFRALDLAVNEYQGGNDGLGAWDATTGQSLPNWPGLMNDLQFLTGPAVADIDGAAGEEVIAGSASMELQAFDALGVAANDRWPKLTGDWTVATPTVGSLGTLDTDAGARKVVIGLTRSGYVLAYGTDAPACSPSSSPRFHHDNANSGDFERDAVLPGRPDRLAIADGKLRFVAPGDDLMCGTAATYEVVTSQAPIDERNFSQATPLEGAPVPAAAGSTETYELPADAGRYVAVRARDEQGNVGRVASIDRGASPGLPGGGAGEAHGPGAGPCANRIAGTKGRDRLRGTPASDRISGRRANDVIRGRGGADCLRGGAGRDRVFGGGGRDEIRGGGGRDRIKGGAGGDEIRPGRGRDRIKGGAGGDEIRAARGGRDRIVCGPGRDTARINPRKDRVDASCERVIERPAGR